MDKNNGETIRRNGMVEGMLEHLEESFEKLVGKSLSKHVSLKDRISQIEGEITHRFKKEIHPPVEQLQLEEYKERINELQKLVNDLTHVAETFAQAISVRTGNIQNNPNGTDWIRGVLVVVCVILSAISVLMYVDSIKKKNTHSPRPGSEPKKLAFKIKCSQIPEGRDKSIEQELRKLQENLIITSFKVDDLRFENHSQHYQGTYSLQMEGDKGKEIIDSLREIKFLKNLAYSSENREAEFICLQECKKCLEILNAKGICETCLSEKEKEKELARKKAEEEQRLKAEQLAKQKAEEEQKKEKELKAQQAQLNEMKAEYKKCELFEKMKTKTPQEKIKRWQQFHDDYLEDIPNSEEDQLMIKNAEEREKYWEEEAKPKVVFCEKHPKFPLLENGLCKKICGECALHLNEEETCEQKCAVCKKHYNNEGTCTQICQECKTHFSDAGVCEVCHPKDWPSNLWNTCWVPNGNYVDFTKSEWEVLGVQKQIDYAKSYQEWYAKRKGKKVEEERILLNDRLKIKMVFIPPGKYKRGSPNGEAGRDSDEGQHTVIISQPFWCGKYEVTQEQWVAVMGTNQSSFRGRSTTSRKCDLGGVPEFLREDGNEAVDGSAVGICLSCGNDEKI